MLSAVPALAQQVTQQPAIQPVPQVAQQVVGITVADSGDTAWMLIAALIALFASLAGFTLFYGGIVRAKNAVSVTIQVMAIMAVVSLLWIILSYSLSFGDGSTLLGGVDNAFLAKLAEIRADTTIPESTFVLFEMVVAIFASTMLVGAFAERARFGWLMTFSLLWSLCVYTPVARWLWGDGWLAELGAHDFGGGIVIQTSVGFAALGVALMLKPRTALPDTSSPAGNAGMMMLGIGILWIGRLALNGGFALTSSDDASTAILNTQIAVSTAALVWAGIAQLGSGKVTALSFAYGALAGLAIIAPAAGYVGPLGALLLGVIGALLCVAATFFTSSFGIDDVGGLFAVQGIGGASGALLFPIFVLPVFGGPGFEQGVTITNQLLAQAIAVCTVALWSLIVSIILGLGITLILPMRVTEADEQLGLDLASHGEQSINSIL